MHTQKKSQNKHDFTQASSKFWLCNIPKQQPKVGKESCFKIIHKHTLTVNEQDMKRMGMLRIVFVWITVTWCLLVPAIAQNVVDTRLLSESSKSDSANGNLRSSRQNKEEKTKEAPKKYSSSDEDFARTLTFNLPTIPPGQRTFNFPANRRPAGGVLSSPGKRPPDGPRGDGKKDEPCRTLPCLYLANDPRPP